MGEGMTERETNARERYEERAGILEYCAAYPRREAERMARAEVAAWLKAHPEDEHGND
jgi:hypothetical protein